MRHTIGKLIAALAIVHGAAFVHQAPPSRKTSPPN